MSPEPALAGPRDAWADYLPRVRRAQGHTAAGGAPVTLLAGSYVCAGSKWDGGLCSVGAKSIQTT